MEANAITLETSTVQPLTEASPTLLRAIAIRKAFGGQVVLDGIDLELRQGEVVLLRGENGSGKTTLLNILTGNIEPDGGEIHYSADDTPRRYRFPRRWWQELNPWDHFKPEFVATEGVGRTWQDVRLFRSLSLRDNIAVAEPNQAGETPLGALLARRGASSPDDTITMRANAALARVGLVGRESSSADKISLGQSKRVAITRAVASGARILFLDEPLAGLDRQGVADVLGLLRSLLSDGLTLVIVEHVFNQAHFDDMVTTVWELRTGKLHAAPVAPSSSALSRGGGRAVTTSLPWLPLLAAIDANTVDLLPRGASVTRLRSAPHGAAKMPVLEIRDLVIRRGARTVIGLDDGGIATGFSLVVEAGETIILQAPNGWGKSTLLAALCGLLDIAKGEIILLGEPIHQLPTWERVRRGLRALPSDNNTFPGLRARDAMKLAQSSENIAAMGELAGRDTSSLSGGQKQRLALLCHANRETAALKIFDEPFSMLDQAAIRATACLLGPNPGGATIITVPALTTDEEGHS